MAPAALAFLYCSQADVESLLSVDGNVGRLDDQNIGSMPALGITYLNQAISWATARVNFFCATRYATADLSTSWIVNEWAIVLTCKWLSSRRGNPPPGSIKDLYESVMEDLKAIRSGEAQLPDIGMRTAAFPSMSNVRVDFSRPLRKIRVERVAGMSDQTPAPYSRNDDEIAVFIPPPL